MSKKHFIELAEYVKKSPVPFTREQILHLADFCKAQNPAFNRERWLDFIDGKCGPNGGAIRK